MCVAAAAWYLLRPAAFGTGNATAKQASDVSSGTAKAGAGRGGAPATTVGLIVAAKQDVPIQLQANGSVAPVSSVDIHPQTTSTIKQVHIKEGQFVRAGELLFSLDDRADRANLEKAQAQLARDQATLADLERQYRRSQELVAQKFIAQSAADTLQSQLQGQGALLKADAAAVQSAQIALSYSTIRSPMAGRVGAINVYPGSLVQLSTSLATVTQLDPISVSFTLPESSLQNLLQAQKSGKVAVKLSSASSSQAVEGALSFIDSAVDPQAGVIRVKALFANRETQLWPGQYVNASVTVQTLKDAIVIPQVAIVTNASSKSVYIMEADQTAKLMPIVVLHSFGANAVVSGLVGGEKVIVEGKQNLRPGAKVQEAPKPGAAAGEKKWKGQGQGTAKKDGA